MRVKGHLSRMAFRLYYYFKSIGILFWIPLLLVDVLLPGLYIWQYLSNGAEDRLRITMLSVNQMLIPLFSAWWPLFILREYVESDGNELLYVYGRRCKLGDILLVYSLYAADVGLLFILYAKWFPEMAFEYIRLMSVGIFYVGMVYFLLYLTKSITPALLTILFYTFGSIIGYREKPIFPLYYQPKTLTLPVYCRYYLPLCILGGALLAVGAYFNKRRMKFV